MSDIDAKTYWENLLGYPLDNWLGISGSALKECYTALGVVSARWNSTENLMRLFTAHYTKIPERFGPIITRHLGNVSMVAMLSDCADIAENDSPGLLEAIKFLCGMFSRCRENRNTLIHSSLVLDLEKRSAQRIEKPIGPRSAEAKTYSCTIDDIKRIADDIDRLNGLFLNLMYALDSRENPSRYTHHTPTDFLRLCKFQLPSKLSLLPPESQQAPPPPQRPQ
jgi:hypothetical protein